MHRIALGLAVLLAAAIIGIGLQYLLAPRAATRSFGLPLPEDGANTTWWLRLKGVRDITSGLVVLATMVWVSPQVAGLILLIDTLIPLGDMCTILAARGSRARAFGIHGVTAAVMLIAAVPLLT